MSKSKTKKDKVIEFLFMNLGVVLMSAGIYFFKIPNGFSTGGVSGVGTIFGKITFLSASEWIFIINLLMLVLGFIVLGKDTGIKTVYCSLVYSGLMWVFEKVIPMSGPLTNQTFLELIYAMLLTAIGSAIIFNCEASAGGTDIPALILKKYTSINIGNALLFVDFLIASSSFLVFGIETGLFSLLGLFMKAFLVDSVIEALSSCKHFMIITTVPEPIVKYIIENMHHGVTKTDATGGFTNDEKVILNTVCKRVEAVKLKKFVKEIDPHAFTVVTTSNEIIGRGFRSV